MKNKSTLFSLITLIAFSLIVCQGLNSNTETQVTRKIITPEPAPTVSNTVSGETIIAFFKAAGLEAENPRKMTKDDYGVAPFVCSGTRFFIPSLGENNGGRVLICDNEQDRDKLVTYYQELGKSSALFFSWVFIKENIVVQINGSLEEDVARKYEQAIP